MTSADKLTEKLLQKFETSLPHERRLIQLLSIAFAPLSKSVLLNVARSSGAAGPTGGNYTGVVLAGVLEKLAGDKLVLLTKDGIRCSTQIMHAATLSAASDGVLDAMTRAVQAEVPMVADWGGAYYRTSLHSLRDVRLAFYRRDVDQAFQMEARYQKQFAYEAQLCHPFVAICTAPFDAAWFRTLPIALQYAALSHILPAASAELSPADGPFEVLCELADDPASPQAVRDLYCLQLMVRGRLADAEQAAIQCGSTVELAVMGWVKLQRGNHAAAIEYFEEGLQKLKKESGKRKTFYDDITGPFFIMALVGSRQTKHRDQAAEHCEFVLSRKEWPHQELYRMLKVVIREHGGERGAGSYFHGYSRQGHDAPLFKLITSLVLFWCGSEEAAAYAKNLPPLISQARTAGYHWFADEAAVAASACGIEPTEADGVLKRYAAEGFIPLSRAVPKVEFWENALSALMNLGKDEQPTQKKQSSQSRLIWHFQAEGRFVEIQPREQKSTPTGKWTSGRNVSLKRLSEEAAQLDFVSAQDVAICGCIKQERDGYSYYGSRETYRLDQDKAIPLMIGHPHVYLDAAANVRLELVLGEPELQLSSHDEFFEMQIYPPFEQDQKIYLQKESPTRIKVFQAKDEYRKVAAILGTGLKLPAAAKDKALEAVKSLSSILTVHSDIGSDSVATVAADATPCFHLLPYNAGIKVELLVRPFSDAGPYFRPGAGGETVMAEVDGKRLQAKRDLRLELRRGAEAVSSLPDLPEAEDSDAEWLIPAPDRALEVLLQLQSLGDSVRVAWPQGAKFKVRQEASSRHCRLSIRQAKDYFELEGEVKLNEGLAVDLQQLIKLAQEGHGRFVALGEGEYLALSAQLKKRLEDLAGFAEPHGKAFRFHPLAAGVFSDFAEEAGEVSTDRQWQAHLKRLAEAQNFQPTLPTTLQTELRGYQEEGFNWLNRLSHWGVGACLADDMGLGKTIQALAQILSMAAKGPSLVVAPTSVCLNWESEVRKFAPTLNVVVFGGGRREEMLKQLKPFDLVICSYGLLQQEGELLAKVDWQAIVLDEAQAIKNMATKRSQAAMELSGAFKMVTTGTPIENHLGELWNVFRFINPGLLGSMKHFNLKFASPIEKGQDKKARGRLKKLIQPFILRRTKNQVLEELPPRTEITVTVEMSEQEAALYEALRRTALENLAGIGKVEGKGEQHLKILAEIMRLRRACCNPRLVLPESHIASSKLEAFAEIVTELRENRHKALVFSQFVGHLELIREYVEKAGIPYQYLDGSTVPKDRKTRMEAFQSGEGDLFLISLKAGGVGLNLTAADYVIHMDPWWNPAVEDQASDRAHRIGQQRPVTIYRLVCKGTIEEKIVGLHQHKRGLADSLLEETDVSGKMSAEELLELLKGEKPAKVW